jgi:hypothetical protein
LKFYPSVFMPKSFCKTFAYFSAFFVLNSISFAQLNSAEILGSESYINNPHYKMNGTRDLGLRYNQKISWLFSGNLALGLNHTFINTMPYSPNDFTLLKNKYFFCQVGGNYNLLTAIRTSQAGDRGAAGDSRISLKGFKLYLCGGVEFLRLTGSPDMQHSKPGIINVYGGFGMEIDRWGEYAKQKPWALVPFLEIRYFRDITGAYYTSPSGIVSFNRWTASIGFKYTFDWETR